ncbi:hypothetical protein H8959_013371 [Pygathrix nigripes]
MVGVGDQGLDYNSPVGGSVPRGLYRNRKPCVTLHWPRSPTCCSQGTEWKFPLLQLVLGSRGEGSLWEAVALPLDLHSGLLPCPPDTTPPASPSSPSPLTNTRELFHSEEQEDIFGEDCVSVKDDSILSVTVDGKTANLNLETRTVECEEGSEDDESLREMVELAAQRLYEALTPVH